MSGDRFDPAKDAINRAKHGLSLAFGDRIFADGDHLILPSIRVIDGEERFKVVGAGCCLRACSSGAAICTASSP